MAAIHAAPDELALEDQRVVMSFMGWRAFEAILALRGDRAGVRMYYLDGAIELMSPSTTHEDRKKTLARLLEMWAVETDLEISGIGSWTLKDEELEAAAEPDECYVRGELAGHDIPELVIEVEYSKRLGLDKREIYRRLGVVELWTLKRDGSLVIAVRDAGGWTDRATSTLFPTLDVPWLLSFLALPQAKAVRALRDALRAKSK